MNDLKIQPYLIFNGQCEAAINFYRQALDAEVEMMMRFKECPDPLPEMNMDEIGERIMHASLRVHGNVLMLSDGCGESGKFEGISLSINLKDTELAKRLFDNLSADGKVNMPLSKTFWSPLFGMVEDRFGVAWMVNIEAEQTAGA